MDARLPAHLEVSGLIRSVQAEGGFATVLSKGDRDAGTILVVVTQNGLHSTAYERMPQLDGTRAWTSRISEDTENKEKFSEFLERRKNQDPDLWIIELDIAHGERFIGL
ncbi:MAG: DUF1491 family protein [Burkholderiales bacterium]|nr:MAG: DUF1491 family protein [Burkholderiales bacterium]